MILFINVFLSNRTQGLRYDRGLLGSAPDRVDVFKYSLASLAPLSWSRVIVHYELGGDCEHRRAEVDDCIETLFAQPIVHHYQNQHQRQWQEAVRAIEAMGDPLVWFCCNDDHVFVDADTALLERLEAVCLELLATTRFVSLVPTHWPEYVAAWSYAIDETPDYFVFRGHVTNSMQVVSTALLRYWWFEHDYGDAWMPRTDAGTLVNAASAASVAPGASAVFAASAAPAAPVRRSAIAPEPYPVLVPYKELVRHFDGYSHVGVDINACPPLFIPEGFFSGAIRVCYGGASRGAGTVFADPFRANYSTVDPAGADIKGTLDDLPLFWRSRMAPVDAETRDALESHRAMRARNEAVIVMATECAAVPASKLRVALRFQEGDDVEAELASLDAYARQWRLARHYEAMTRLRTAAGVEQIQAVWRALHERETLGSTPSDRARADAIRLLAIRS